MQPFEFSTQQELTKMGLRIIYVGIAGHTATCNSLQVRLATWSKSVIQLTATNFLSLTSAFVL